MMAMDDNFKFSLFLPVSSSPKKALSNSSCSKQLRMIGFLVHHTISSPSLLSFSDTGKPSTTKVHHHKQLQISAKEISKNPYVWNTRIRTSIEKNRHQQALILYLSMVKEIVPPDEFTFPLVIKACSVLKDIKVGKQIHTQVLKNGFLVAKDVFVLNSLLYMYANCGFLEIARMVFDGMAERTLVSWNSMMAGYSKCVGFGFEAIVVYVLMLKGGILPDCFSFTFLVRACSSALAVEEAAQIHSHVIKLGFESNALVRTGLIDMYVKFGSVNVALVLFDRSIERDVVSWNALITGLIRMGELGSAEALFNKMDVRNVVSWNTMISGYLQNGFCSEALDYFRRMQLEGVNPNSVTVVSVLSACSVAGSLSLGKWVHLYSESQGLIGSNEMVKAALVNMYAKCGDLESAHGIFETMVEKDVVSWDVMIEGFALHGRGGDALELFHQMIREGVKPDEITFIGLLNACRHTGLVNEGLKFFRSMSIEFGIKPNLEHFACIVDLLSRAGRLTEALEVVKAMPMAPDVVVWSALLGACRTQNDLLLAESVVEHIMRLNPACSSNYVALSNIYAARNQWADVARVRRMMKTKEAKKEPGCSLIEIGGAVTEFTAGDSSHHQCREIFQKLDELMKQIKINGYVPNTDSVLHDMEQEEMERSLYFHSEKLAVAFGIINTSPGTVIRIVKNLRICMDCHSAIKLIAQIEGREIIVRDRNRFHHFKDGQCSCGNYW